MNWTGGKLHRHSRNPNDALTTRQKQHFAQVRTGLLHGGRTRRASPFVPSFMRSRMEDRLGRSSGQRTFNGRSGIVKDGQKTLKEYENTARVAERLDMMGARRVVGQRKKRRLSADRSGQNGLEKSTASVAGGDYAEESDDLGRDDLQSSTPINTSRQVYGQVTQEHDIADRSETWIEQNRRRLLEKRDWAALEPSWPMHATRKRPFHEERGDEERSKGEVCKHQNERLRIPSPRIASKPVQYLMSGALPAKEHRIKVRIGQDALDSQWSTRASETGQRLSLPRVGSSDTMLFDVETHTDELADRLDRTETRTDAFPNPPFEIHDSWIGSDVGLVGDASDKQSDTGLDSRHQYSLDEQDSTRVDKLLTDISGNDSAPVKANMSSGGSQSTRERGWRGLLLKPWHDARTEKVSENRVRPRSSPEPIRKIIDGHPVTEFQVNPPEAFPEGSSCATMQSAESSSISPIEPVENPAEGNVNGPRSTPKSLQQLNDLTQQPCRRPLQRDDPDELWKSFVFGGNEEILSGSDLIGQFESTPHEQSSRLVASSMRAACSCSSELESPASSVVALVGDGTSMNISAGLSKQDPGEVTKSGSELASVTYTSAYSSDSGGSGASEGTRDNCTPSDRLSMYNNPSRTVFSSPDPLQILLTEHNVKRIETVLQ